MDTRIIYTNEEGGVTVLTPSPNTPLTIQEIAAKDVPEGTAFEIVDVADIPIDRTFRDAWVKSGVAIETDIPKAKVIAHDKRRAQRGIDFEPLDRLATVPALAEEAEVERVTVREKYAIMQIAIDAATDETALKTSIEEL